MFGHIFGLLFAPTAEWRRLASLSEREIKKRLLYPLVMGAIPPVAFYWGTTRTGWAVMGDDPIRLTPDSALPLAVLFYAALVGGVAFIGWMMHWMSRTYDADSFPEKGVVFMGYAATPVFLAGALGVYPVWWLDILLATAACSYAIRLVYLGVPPFMKVPEERGILYASAVFAVALVYVVAVLSATTILWEYVATPVFDD